LLVLAMPARSQARLGAGAGLTIPVGELGRIDQVGYQLNASLQSTPQLATVGFRADAMYAAMGRKETIQDITERIVGVSLGAMIRARSTASSYPYAVGALGLYNQSTSPRPIGGTSSTDLGFNAGLGARFTLGNRTAFAEARYHHMTSGGARFVPVTLGFLF
jgi:hypothetical protein